MGGPSGSGKALDPVEEKKRQDRRRRERRHREREALKDPKKPSRKLDIIDQLDATSIYGMGGKQSPLVFDLYHSNPRSIPSRWPI